MLIFSTPTGELLPSRQLAVALPSRVVITNTQYSYCTCVNLKHEAHETVACITGPNLNRGQDIAMGLIVVFSQRAMQRLDDRLIGAPVELVPDEHPVHVSQGFAFGMHLRIAHVGEDGG